METEIVYRLLNEGEIKIKGDEMFQDCEWVKVRHFGKPHADILPIRRNIAIVNVIMNECTCTEDIALGKTVLVVHDGCPVHGIGEI